MKFSIIILFLFIWGLSYAQLPRYAVEQGKIIVKFEADAVPQVERRLKSLQSANPDDTTTLQIGLKSLDRANKKHHVTRMKRVFPYAGKYEAKHRKYGLHLWYELTIPEDKDPSEIAREYKLDQNVQISEPRYSIRSLSMPPPAVPDLPNDPSFDKQWHYYNTGQTGGVPGTDIKLPDAWQIAKDLGVKKEVIVAIVDGGVNYSHVDLKDNMWTNDAELNGQTGVDDDRNGYVDDIYGFNFVKRRNELIGTIEPEDHATHVAGTVAAVTGNGTGVSGITGSSDQGYRIKVMNTQILTATSSVSSLSESFIYAADKGAVISQNSWGYENPNQYSETDLEAINYFIQEAGRDENGNPRPGTPMVGGIVIFAAGNDSQDAKWYPAYYDNVLAVAATNHYGRLAWYSNYGSWIDITAPGGDTKEKLSGGVYSTSYTYSNRNYYEFMQGTSMACPHVSGTAALILSVYGSETYTPEMLKDRLLNTTTPLSLFDPANVSKMGRGLLNAAAALSSVNPPNKVNDLTAVTPETGESISVSLNWTKPDITGQAGYASSYTIVYSTEPIIESSIGQYPSASVYSIKLIGDAEQYLLTGLKENTTYYITILANTSQGVASGMPNAITHKTRSNKQPVITNPLPGYSIRNVVKHNAFYIGNIFTDPDGDKLTYTVSVGNPEMASAYVEGDSLFITPVAAGNTTITLTADDKNDGITAVQSNLTVNLNHAPVITGLPRDTVLLPNNTITINLSEYISDPEGDPVRYTYSINQTGIIQADITNQTLTIKSVYHGHVTLTLTAYDSYNAASEAKIDITVEQKYLPSDIGDLLVYPNPTNGILYYSLILDKTAKVTFRIMNSIGKKMYEIQYDQLEAGSHYFNVDLSNWSSGMYVIQYLKNDKATSTKKVIKL